ncbi:hypothetical protein GT347_04760 [Xylophilus rhododendri]|uniref:Uncharacterized protein n=1 Tax=Xylophilus rhododendri TaxID=2697032 RepID=A0A857J2S4_9BURK|nr:hypothetical protein [Xylophilus rhododendri]QHI97352.1 hypothetical protein GT347_04760 [Xylophilus rhododendri]
MSAGYYPAELRQFLQLFQEMLASTAALADAAAPQEPYRSLKVLFLIPCLAQELRMRDTALLQAEQPTQHCPRRGRAPTPPPSVQEVERLRTVLQALSCYLHIAIVELLPLTQQVLEELREWDVAAFVQEGRALLEPGGRLCGEPPRRRHQAQWMLMGCAIRAVMLRHAVPQGWTEPPDFGPADQSARGMPLPGDYRACMLQFERAAWLRGAVCCLVRYCTTVSMRHAFAWVQEAMATTEATAQDMCIHVCCLAGRARPARIWSRIAPVRGWLQSIVDQGPKPGQNIDATLLQALQVWCTGMADLLAWLKGHGPDGPVGHGLDGPLENMEAAPQPPAAARPGPAPRVMRAAMPAPPRPSVPASRSTRDMSPADALPLLQAAALEGPQAAVGALGDFLQGRRMRATMRGLPAPLATQLLQTLHALVQACETGTPQLGFMAIRELLDVGWHAADAAAGQALVEGVFRHLATGPHPQECPSAFRLFCLAGGLERLFQAIPAAHPETARAVLCVLERRLALQAVEDEQAVQRNGSPLSEDLPRAIRQRRLDDRGGGAGSPEDQREDSAPDLPAWLAGLAHAVAPFAGEPAVRSLVDRLAGLLDLAWAAAVRAVGASAAPANMRTAALHLLTAGGSAACRIDKKRRWVGIDARKLHTPLFLALLQHLQEQRLDSGGPAFSAIDMQLGKRQEDDGARAEDRKWHAVARWAASQSRHWCFQQQGATVLYAHRGERPREDWASWVPVEPVEPSRDG